MVVAVIITVVAIGLIPILLIRFRKRWVAAFNLAITNRVTSPFAPRLPGFGLLTHVGRTSGRLYRTPVNVFRTPEGFMIALTYGQEAQWVQNIMAAGGCRLETRGRSYQLSTPAVVHDPSRARFPFPVRIILRIIGATDFLQLSTARAHAAPQLWVADERSQ